MSLWNRTLKRVDLTHQLDEHSPYWGGMPEGAVELNTPILDFDSPYNLRIQRQTFPGQFGTHVDFPCHFHKEGKVAKDFTIDHAVLPLVVLDKHEEVAGNVDFELSVADIEAHEEEYGPIPADAFVAFRFDWHKRWPDADALTNADASGNLALHNRGCSAGVVGGGGSNRGKGRGLPMMEVPTPSIRKTSTCSTLPSFVPT